MKIRKNEIIQVKNIIVDAELYPRASYSWQTALDYKHGMENGERFPLITLAKLDGKYYLIDGKHRLEAIKSLKHLDKKGKRIKPREKYIKAEVMTGMTRAEIYIEAINKNSKHGLPFTAYDKARMIIKLRDLKISEPRISKIVGMPIASMKTFESKKMMNTFGGKVIALKKPLRSFAGTISNKENIETLQHEMGGDSQYFIIRELVVLFENKLINLKDPNVKSELKLLKKYLTKIR